MGRKEYRVVWRDRYYHASAPTQSYESAEAFLGMLRGVAYAAEIQSRDLGLGSIGSGPWSGVHGTCEERVDEISGPASWAGTAASA